MEIVGAKLVRKQPAFRCILRWNVAELRGEMKRNALDVRVHRIPFISLLSSNLLRADYQDFIFNFYCKNRKNYTNDIT